MVKIYWCRLWKRIHRPLIAFAIIGFVIVTASNVGVEFKDDESRDSYVEDWTDRDLLVKSVASDNSKRDDGVPLLGAIPPMPVNPVRQLPYCKNSNDKQQSKNGDESVDQGNSNSSDQVAVSNTGRLGNINDGRSILVATLDGQLSLLDQAGRILWSVGTGQVFSSTISSLQVGGNVF